jgi:hypothetical protein
MSGLTNIYHISRGKNALFSLLLSFEPFTQKLKTFNFQDDAGTASKLSLILMKQESEEQKFER